MIRNLDKLHNFSLASWKLPPGCYVSLPSYFTSLQTAGGGDVIQIHICSMRFSQALFQTWFQLES